MHTELVTATDTGMVRRRNEDFVLVDHERGIAVLCDGMGGHLAGDVASRLGAESILEVLAEDSVEIRAPTERLQDAFDVANRLIIEAAKEHLEWSGMGATVVAAMFAPASMVAAHLGDSRLYRLRAGDLELLTEDHTVSQQYVRRGVLSAEAAQSWIGRSMLLRALGIDDEVDADTITCALEPGDCYLLCSDGLTDACSEPQIRDELIHPDTELQELAARLVDIANGNGGPDNISVVLARVSDDSGHGSGRAGG